jgi:parallel beta-helix repeat protein
MIFINIAILLFHLLQPTQSTIIQCTSDPISDTSKLNQATHSCLPGNSIIVIGTCLISRTILLPYYCDFLGQSRSGTILKQANNTNLQAILSSKSWNNSKPWTSSPSRIAHLSVDGNSLYNQNSAVNDTAAIIIESWNSVVEDVHIYDSGGDGLKVTSLGRDSSTVLKTSQVNSRFDGLFIERSKGHGFHVQDPVNAVTDSNLLNSWISNSGQSGIYLENAAGWSVRNNHLYGNSIHGIYANRCYGTSIEGNYVEDFGRNPGNEKGWYYGIACVPQSNAGSIISNNKVFQLKGENYTNLNSSFAYIGVPATHGVGVLNIVNNLIRGNGCHNCTNEVGLRYRCGKSGTNLLVMSQGNNVVSAGVSRDVDEKTTLVAGL